MRGGDNDWLVVLASRTRVTNQIPWNTSSHSDWIVELAKAATQMNYNCSYSSCRMERGET